ncbi:MAG: SRPBCC domain-containing protein [Verrucomicrobia bacterium]|nr:MAG: SRPBCC domain-containing protein [Verrucomicrobiota bacterium]
MKEKGNLKTAEKTSLEIKRFINVPRNRVYEAWTDPAQLRQWFGPENVRTRDIVAETRVGGKFRWDLTNPEGEEMTVQGEYRELQPGRKIVFTWQWQDDETWENHSSIVTVGLSDVAGGTELRLMHEQLPNEESRDNHNDGWKSLLNKLGKFLKQKAEGKR